MKKKILYSRLLIQRKEIIKGEAKAQVATSYWRNIRGTFLQTMKNLYAHKQFLCLFALFLLLKSSDFDVLIFN
jgi:hypothetical protein